MMYKKFITFVLLGSLVTTAPVSALSPAGLKNAVKSFVASVTEKRFVTGNVVGAAVALSAGYAYCKYFRNKRRAEGVCPTCGEKKDAGKSTLAV